MVRKEDFENQTVPRTYLAQQDGSHIKMDLTPEQFEEFQRRGIEMTPISGGLLIQL